VNYQVEFTEAFLKNVDSAGSPKQKRQVHDIVSDQDKQTTFMKQLSELNLPNIDMRLVWTHHFPRAFFKKPAVVDWEHERLFKVDDESLNTMPRKWLYFVIPKYKLGSESVNLELNNFAANQFRKQVKCNNCYEIVYRK
jgi:hypothetical protein